MAKKLFVGGLPYSTTQDELSQLFSQVGNVASAVVIVDKFSGRSKGFGFVEFDNDDEAQAAIDKFNGTDLGGRNIVVNEARPMTERKPRRDFGGGGGRRDFNSYDRGSNY